MQVIEGSFATFRRPHSVFACGPASMTCMAKYVCSGVQVVCVQVFACGPASMVESVEKATFAMGSKWAFHKETFEL